MIFPGEKERAYLSDQPRPVPTEDFFIPLRIEDAGDIIIRSRHLPFSPCEIAVEPLVSDHLFTSVMSKLQDTMAFVVAMKYVSMASTPFTSL